MMTVLSVAYPFAPVSSGAVGGAEQVLHTIDRALMRAGHRSLVIACEGSHIAGTLIRVPAPASVIDDTTRASMCERVRAAIARVLDSNPVDLLHFHGVDFARHLTPHAVPALVTLHLPLDWYEPWPFRILQRHTYFNCVSESQRARAAVRVDCPVIENGVDVAQRTAPVRRLNFALSMGRICAEKNFHVAMDAAQRAGISFLLAGAVFQYPDHVRYFQQEIAPRLNSHCRFVGAVGIRGKQRLLSAARCVLIPSTAAETSSLVAMEALSAGTPVVVFRRGALPSIIEDGVTGFVVENERELAEAITACDAIDRGTCTATARRRFSAERMTREYFNLYESIVQECTLTKSKRLIA
jgi:glycosyltransferase involved in cell wall biosynthesis